MIVPLDGNILIKIGEYDHLKELIDEGKLYMKPLSYFRQPLGKGVGDPEEGSFLLFKDIEVFQGDLYCGRADMNIYRDHEIRYPVFCCFNLFVEKIGKHLFYGKIKREVLDNFFNQKKRPALVAFPKDELIKKLQASEFGCKIEFGPIQYTDTFWRSRSCFQKGTNFSGQQEFRVIFKEQTSSHKVITVGTLTPIPGILEFNGSDDFSGVGFLLNKTPGDSKTTVSIRIER